MAKTNKDSDTPKKVTYTSTTNRYLESIDLAKTGNLELDLVMDAFAGAEFCFHRIFELVHPKTEKGITYPDNFRYWKLLPRERLGEVESRYISTITNDLDPLDIKKLEFLAPIFCPGQDPKQAAVLNSVVKRLVALEPEVSSQRGISIDPSGLEELGLHPRAFLPCRSWFNKALNDLQIEDILTILPEAEQEIYSLAIGRVVVGASGTYHVGSSEMIEHQWRTAPVITGLPGIGKSTLTMGLIEAIKSTGYAVSVFKDLSGRFGIGEIVTADMAYADDLNQDTFQKYIKSSVVKQAITGGEIKTEKKFLDEVTTKPSACFISNINDFNVACTYGTDDGVLDRLKILNTRMPTELDAIQSTFKGISKHSPSLHPIPHFKYLCDKLDCSQNALFLKFVQLCAEKFISHVREETLNSAINEYSTKLDIQLHKHYDKVIAMVFQLSYILMRDEDTALPLPDLKPSLLGSCVHSANFVVSDQRAHPIREQIKKDWKERDRPSFHPWTGIKLLDQISLDNADNAYQEVHASFADRDIDKCIKIIFTCLRLNQGYNVPANTTQVIQSWEGSRKQFPVLSCLAAKIKENLDKRTIELLHSEPRLLETDHIREIGYDRQQFADKLNSTMSSSKKGKK